MLITAERLLGGNDPAPVEVINGDRNHGVVLICEHAGRAVPAALGDLGLGRERFDLHIAYDIGAGAVSRSIAERIGAPLVLQPYSRLVVDCNRPVHSPEAIPEISDGVEIPKNRNIDEIQRQQRVDEIFKPFHDAVANVIDRHPRRLLLAIHSFTPVLAGVARPWDVGFLFRDDRITSGRLATLVGEIEPNLSIGMNEPYSIGDLTDFFVPHHGERRGIAHSLVEIRNDHLVSEGGRERWADLMARAVERFP